MALTNRTNHAFFGWELPPGSANPDNGLSEFATIERNRKFSNKTAQEGCSRCECGCKYWENDRCIDCDTAHHPRHDA